MPKKYPPSPTHSLVPLHGSEITRVLLQRFTLFRSFDVDKLRAVTVGDLNLPASPPTDTITGTNQTLLSVTPDSSDALIIEGHILKVIEATDNLVRYTIEKLE